MTDLYNAQMGALPSSHSKRPPLPKDAGMRSGSATGKPNVTPTIIAIPKKVQKIVSINGALRLVEA